MWEITELNTFLDILAQKSVELYHTTCCVASVIKVCLLQGWQSKHARSYITITYKNCQSNRDAVYKYWMGIGLILLCQQTQTT